MSGTIDPPRKVSVLGSRESLRPVDGLRVHEPSVTDGESLLGTTTRTGRRSSSHPCETGEGGPRTETAKVLTKRPSVDRGTQEKSFEEDSNLFDVLASPTGKQPCVNFLSDTGRGPRGRPLLSERARTADAFETSSLNQRQSSLPRDAGRPGGYEPLRPSPLYSSTRACTPPDTTDRTLRETGDNHRSRGPLPGPEVQRSYRMTPQRTPEGETSLRVGSRENDQGTPSTEAS